MARARDAGAKRILVLVPRAPLEHEFSRAAEVALLGGLATLWEPLEAREARPEAELEPVEAPWTPPGEEGEGS